MTIAKPQPSEYHSFYDGYVQQIGDLDVCDVLHEQLKHFHQLVEQLTPDELLFAYAPGKWKVIEVLGHMTDTERIMSYRLLRFCRGDQTALPGFEENDYVAQGRFADTSKESLLKEFECMRRANLELIGRLNEADLDRSGGSNGTMTSVRALVYILAGHLQHHLGILKDRYSLS